jgi:hypothetical protein
MHPSAATTGLDSFIAAFLDAHEWPQRIGNRKFQQDLADVHDHDSAAEAQLDRDGPSAQKLPEDVTIIGLRI